jgi:hypothetical protein
LNCANSTAAGNLGVFFAKVRGEHNETKEVVESKTMVYVIEGDIILVSRAILETLGCIPKTFPQVGQFLTDDDDALTGRAFAVNPDPIGLMSDGTKAPSMPEAIARTIDKPKPVEPSANAAKASMTSYKASKMAGTRTDPPEVAREVIKKEDVTKTAVRQPKGECDPESDLPCSCPRRRFVEPPDKLPMPATASNRKVLEDFIKDHFKAGAFNTCKRQYWPITAGPPMKIHTPPDAPRVYCGRLTKVPLHFREEVKAGLEADVKKGVLERVTIGEADTCKRRKMEEQEERWTCQV